MSEERLERIEVKIDRVQETQYEIKADLQYHIKRTDLLERHMKYLERYVEKHLNIIKWGGGLIALGTALVKLWQLLR